MNTHGALILNFSIYFCPHFARLHVSDCIFRCSCLPYSLLLLFPIHSSLFVYLSFLTGASWVFTLNCDFLFYVLQIISNSKLQCHLKILYEYLKKCNSLFKSFDIMKNFCSHFYQGYGHFLKIILVT